MTKKRAGDVLDLVVAGAVFTGHPAAGAAAKAMKAGLNLISERFEYFKNRRIAALWEHAVGGEDPAAFAEKVSESMLRDGDPIGQAFVAAAQAALDSVALAAAPSIGLLAGMFVRSQGSQPERRFYRAMLNVLRTVDDVEFGLVRDAIHRLHGAKRRSSTVANTKLVQVSDVWEWRCTDSQPMTTVLRGDNAPLVVSILEPIASTPPGKVNDRDKPRFRLLDLEVLVEIMPLPR